MSKRWIVVFQTLTDRGWSDNFGNHWPRFDSRSDALKLKAIWNASPITQPDERYVVRRVK